MLARLSSALDDHNNLVPTILCSHCFTHLRRRRRPKRDSVICDCGAIYFIGLTGKWEVLCMPEVKVVPDGVDSVADTYVSNPEFIFPQEEAYAHV